MDKFDNVVIYRASKNNPGVGKRLAEALGCGIVTSQTQEIPEGTLVVNYGRSTIPAFGIGDTNKYLNRPSKVADAVNKLKTLNILKQKGFVDILEFTEDINIANQWKEECGYDIVCRKTLTGKQGDGIKIIKHSESFTIPEAPLYTQYYNKTHEFRVHVCRGKVIDFVQKKKMGATKLAKRGLEKPNELIRNHKRGWVFAHNNLVCSPDDKKVLEALGIKAVKSLELDFGGVDILAKFTENDELYSAIVCEVNSAPGMRCSATFNGYLYSIKELLK